MGTSTPWAIRVHHGERPTTLRFLPSPRRALAAVALCVVGLTVLAAPALGAEAAASAFGAQVAISGTDVLAPTPTASVAAPAGDDSNVLVGLNTDPVAVNGTLTASAAAHSSADITSVLTVVDQELPGPYNAHGVGEVEDLGLVYDVAGQDVALVSAALVRAEAVVVCGSTPSYSAASEIVDLQIAGTAVPLNAPVQDLIDAISGVLADTGLDAVVDVERNVVTDIAGGGIAIDALVVTILNAAGDTPLATVRLAHAEVTSAACVTPPQCSDGADNDGDAVIDAADPGCHTDGDATNASTYDPNDDNEIDELVRAAVQQLPRTGTSSTAAVVGITGLGLALGGLALRRRLSLV